MEKLIEYDSYPVRDAINILLQDKTTKKNIIFATKSYINNGVFESSEISKEFLHSLSLLEMQPRVCKAKDEQSDRTRKKAEVFTPTWICNLMNNHIDNEWFGRENVFNTQIEHEWCATSEKILFSEDKDWKMYVDSRRLEITCGEAPYIVSRYDATTGEIIPIENRIGILDRKLRVVNENTDTEEEWMKWTIRAFQSVYGYEYQGDNLLIARINLLISFSDYLKAKWNRQATNTELRKIANIISWNFWQMNGLTNTIPAFQEEMECVQMSLFEENPETTEQEKLTFCKIMNWRRDNSIQFKKDKKRGKCMKFDYIIGNPPYQQDSNGANESDTPLYHFFYDSAFEIADKVELITPARFLFNAGYTPKKWNEKMLADEHFKVLFFEQKSSKVFTNTDIKGGIAITYRDVENNFGALGVFTAFSQLNSIKRKVDVFEEMSLSEVVSNRGLYKYSKKAYEERPDEMTKTADARIAPSSFERMPSLFTDIKPTDEHEYIQIFGLTNGERLYKWIRKDYVREVNNLNKYKVMIPKANGSGAIGEVLSTPLVGTPLVGFTETFISIGETDSKEEAEATLKYVKSKFARTMLGILKVTQNNPKDTWLYVPLQNFTEKSDIDWTKSIADIDKQLYKKYGLSQDEIDFIETHVKEMT